MYKKSHLIFFLLVCGGIFQLHGQEQKLALGLEEILRIGGAKNLTILEFKEKQALAAANLDSAKEWWLPEIYAGGTIHQLKGNVMNIRGYILSDINRQNFWGGLGANMNWNLGRGLYGVEAAKLKYKASNYETVAEKNKALLSMIDSYYDFLADQLNFKAYEELVSQAKIINKQISNQVTNGIKQESDELVAKSNLSHLKIKLLNAKSSYKNSSAKLVRLLDLDPGIELIAIDSFLMPIDMEISETPSSSLKIAFENRAELKFLEMKMLSLAAEKKMTTTGLLLPELNIRANGSYFGDVIYNLAPTGGINASLLWKIPLGRIVYKGNLKRYDSRLNLQQISLDRLEAKIGEEVISATRILENTKEQLQLAQEGSRFASKALEQIISSVQLGTASSFDLYKTQEIYLRSRLDYIKIVAAYNKALYRYRVALGGEL